MKSKQERFVSRAREPIGPVDELAGWCDLSVLPDQVTSGDTCGRLLSAAVPGGPPAVSDWAEEVWPRPPPFKKEMRLVVGDVLIGCVR